MALVYTPPSSLKGFLTSEAFLSFVVGPVGSTKTTAGIMRIAYLAQKMAACRDGLRRSRCVWVRNTREQLRDTSIPDFLKWYPDGLAGVYLKTDYKFLLKFNDVECEVLFRGLDEANDVRRVLSLQASFAVLDEFREIHKDVFEALQGRLGRYPDSMMVPHRPEWGVDEKGNPVGGCVTEDGKSNKHMWGMTNPPDLETYWENFLSNPPRTAEVFFQPGALSPEADWVKFLPSNYYEDLAEGKSQDWVDVYINNKFGKSLSGKPVFASFNHDFHLSKGPLRVFRASSRPLIVGMDFGLNPSATINQLDPQGRLLTFSSLTSDGMGILRFIRTLLRPHLAEKFAGLPVLVVGDPAGSQRAQTDERSVFDILKSEGFHVTPARTNNIVARINAVETWLNRQVDGGPAHIIDAEGAPHLVAAMRGAYRYKVRKNGETEPAPDKNGPSHVADAHQYACLYAEGPTPGAVASRTARAIVVASAGGWT